jgi:8-oxo-dGTP pyrophosphatase MutT (NUDIX family)
VPRTQQIAALPWREGDNGVEILLITTRTTRRWVIPKGWTMDGKADCEAAAIEAFEEAGVEGHVEAIPIGRYGYLKILKSGKPRRLHVRVFALAVEKILEDWPEKAERQRQWYSPKQAVALCGEPELVPILAVFAKCQGVVLEPVKPINKFMARLKSWWRKLT